MKKILSGVLVVAVVGLGGWQLLKGYRFRKLKPLPQTSVPSVVAETAAAEKNVIVYSDNGFSPSPLMVKVGTTVTFKNNSSQAMWTASAKHPTHTVYPTTGGCLGSTFDACRGVQPGDSWSFKFEVAGSWGYHDHLNPSHFGKIVVEQ